MKIKKVILKDFKRFTNLTIDIPKEAKLVVLIGENGSGKTSVLEGFRFFQKGNAYISDNDYIYKTLVHGRQRRVFRKTDDIKIEFYDCSDPESLSQEALNTMFYFRTAYRNEASFETPQIAKQKDVYEENFRRLPNLSQNDQTVSNNYQRLVLSGITKLFGDQNDDIKVKELKEKLIGKIKKSLSNIFEDLQFSNIGKNPLQDGGFYFEKGDSKNFNYKNLSAGEKSVFDLILDLIIMGDFYQDTIFCIDEPEAHIHTKLQSKLLKELYNLIPDNSQLWISTHSIGILKEAEKINKKPPNAVAFLDFSNHDFDDSVEMHPVKIDKAITKRFFELALGDFSNLVLPEIIIFCEGDPNGKSNKNFDSIIYNAIFEETKPNIQFISVGNQSDVINIGNNPLFNTLLDAKKIQIIKFIDNDSLSENQVKGYKKDNIKVTSCRHIEGYLFDDEIITKLFKGEEPQKINEYLHEKDQITRFNREKGKQSDDIKSASGALYNAIKNIIDIPRSGSTVEAFKRDTLAPLITEETKVYKKLEKDIFG